MKSKIITITTLFIIIVLTLCCSAKKQTLTEEYYLDSTLPEVNIKDKKLINIIKYSSNETFKVYKRKPKTIIVYPMINNEIRIQILFGLQPSLQTVSNFEGITEIDDLVVIFENNKKIINQSNYKNLFELTPKKKNTKLLYTNILDNCNYYYSNENNEDFSLKDKDCSIDMIYP